MLHILSIKNHQFFRYRYLSTETVDAVSKKKFPVFLRLCANPHLSLIHRGGNCELLCELTALSSCTHVSSPENHYLLFDDLNVRLRLEELKKMWKRSM